MRSHYLPLIFLLWCALIWIAPSSVFWRDSGEFIVQAFTLDIAHPAGFPTYALIANSLTLLPLGPIAWRVVLVSSLSLIIALYSLFLILREFNPRHQLSPIHFLLTTTLLIAILPLVIKQAQSAEVYLLNGAMLLGIAILILKGIKLNDVRFLMSASLLGGLAVGNHISAALSGILLSLTMLAISPLFRRSLCALLICFLVGLSSYCYLPLRANQSPPMNTGLPNTMIRFWSVVSDARDRVLRPASSVADTTLNINGYDKLIPNPLTNFANDLEKIGVFSPAVFVSLTVISLITCLIYQPRATLVLSSIGIGNYLFFAGWDGDPWIVAMSAITIMFVTTLQMFIGWALPLMARGQKIVTAISLILILWFGEFIPLSASAFDLRNYQEPADYALRWLNASQAPVVISENTWFLARYLSDIEGVGDNRLLVYQPALLFPEYFNPIKTSQRNGKQFDSLQDGGGEITFGHFLETMAHQDYPILIDPSQAINHLITPIAILQKSGTTEIARGTYADSSIDPMHSEILHLLSDLSSAEFSESYFIRGDRLNFRDNVLGAHLDLWQKQGKGLQAIAMIDLLCGSPNDKRCSVAILNQRGLILLGLKKFTEAAEYYRELANNSPQELAVISKNLSLAEKLGAVPIE